MVNTLPNEPPACNLGGVLVLPFTMISKVRKPVPVILFKMLNFSVLRIILYMDFLLAKLQKVRSRSSFFSFQPHL